MYIKGIYKNCVQHTVTCICQCNLWFYSARRWDYVTGFRNPGTGHGTGHGTDNLDDFAWWRVPRNKKLFLKPFCDASGTPLLRVWCTVSSRTRTCLQVHILFAILLLLLLLLGLCLANNHQWMPVTIWQCPATTVYNNNNNMANEMRNKWSIIIFIDTVYNIMLISPKSSSLLFRFFLRVGHQTIN